MDVDLYFKFPVGLPTYNHFDYHIYSQISSNTCSVCDNRRRVGVGFDGVAAVLMCIPQILRWLTFSKDKVMLRPNTSSGNNTQAVRANKLQAVDRPPHSNPEMGYPCVHTNSTPVSESEFTAGPVSTESVSTAESEPTDSDQQRSRQLQQNRNLQQYLICM